MAFQPEPLLDKVVLSQKLDLFISCRNLPKLDVNSPSDPFVVISVKNEVTNKLTRLGCTEIVKDNHNPDFTKDIKIDYFFEEVQIIRLDAYDADSQDVNNLSQHDYIGNAEFILGDLVTAQGQKLAIQLKDKTNKKIIYKKAPTAIIVRCEEISDNKEELVIQFGCKDLPKMDWFGKVDPFLQIYRASEDGGWMAVVQSEIIKNNYNPLFKPLSIPVQRLCNGDYGRPILIKCFDWNKNAEPDYVAECTTSLQELLDVSRIEFRKKDKNGQYKTKNYGELNVKMRDIKQKHTFIEYIIGGCDIQLMVAIDFTGSNGDPRDAKSLHYMGPPNYESPYLRAIRSVGRVLESYDSDKMIAAFGFGANINPPQKMVSHCFPLTFDNDRTEVHGIEQLTQTYLDALNRVQLYGPTYFNEVINTVAALTSTPVTNQKQHYTLLLIITDGVINDMNQTTDAIVSAATLPLSIIIVGVGNADFKQMEILDADEVKLKHTNGTVMQRDIVQFVPFNKFANEHISLLAKETLAEVPNQLLQYMEYNKIYPMKPKLGRENTIDLLYESKGDISYNSILTQQQLSPPPQQQQIPPSSQQQFSPPPQQQFSLPPQQQFSPPPQQQFSPPPQQFSPPPQQQFSPPPQQQQFSSQQPYQPYQPYQPQQNQPLYQPYQPQQNQQPYQPYQPQQNQQPYNYQNNFQQPPNYNNPQPNNNNNNNSSVPSAPQWNGQ